LKPRLISLFSGCGGLDFGFHETGFDIIWGNDFLADACETYKLNFKMDLDNRDLNEIDTDDIPDGDLLIGGPPCQSFSLLGKRNVKDKRGGLADKYFEILEKKKPDYFLFENVLGFKSAKTASGARVMDIVEKKVTKMGYSMSIDTLNSADYGVPQRRKRVFIYGSLNFRKLKYPKATHSEFSSSTSSGNDLQKWVSSSDALSDLPDPSDDVIPYNSHPQTTYQKNIRLNSDAVYHHYPPYSSAKDMEIIRSVTPGGNYMDVPDEIATKRILNFKRTGGRTTTYGRLHPDKPAYTINTWFNRPNVGCNIHYLKDRLITIREALRLQSFPDRFKLFSSNKRNYHVQVGNAVPPLLSRAWAQQFLEYMKND
jgi:DNA (cytosine-5)-methyltransferase 1